MQKVLTGYPSVEKPWRKYYRETELRQFNVNQTLYQLLWEANQENLDAPALNFLGIEGNTWTYRELFHQADCLAGAFQKNGVKEGDTVLVVTISGPEEAMCLLALNKIGVVSKWIDITVSSKEMEEAIQKDGCEYVVCFALAVPRLVEILDNTRVKKVLYVDPSQFIRLPEILKKSPKNLREVMALKKNEEPLPAMPQDPRFIKFTKFIKESKGTSFTAPYVKDRPVLKIQSSGTTGKPKVIAHSNYAINCSIAKFRGMDFPLYPGYALLKTAPGWVAYGLINALGVGLAFGLEVLTTPVLKEDILLRFNQKYDIADGVPLHYRYLYEHIDEIQDMSRPIALVSGGDKISKGEIETFTKAFSALGCKAPILNGAGSNEVLGAAVMNPLLANRPGSIGIPLYGDCAGIFDPDTMEEKQYGEEGEICYRTEAAFLEYENNEEMTKAIKKIHKDGSTWIHSKDLGYMDSDGFIYLAGRISRVITVGAFKISANQIEEAVQICKEVKECVAIAVPDTEYGEVPMVFLVLDEKAKGNPDEILERVKIVCRRELKEKAVPRYFEIIDSIPYTSNNKQNFRLLEELGKEIVGKRD